MESVHNEYTTKLKTDTSDQPPLAGLKGDSAARSPALDTPKRMGKIDLDPENVKNGIAQLILTLVTLLHELLERQAIRRIDAGSLSDEQIERLGLALLKQAQEIERIRKEFGLEKEDLNLDLGPLGKLL